MITEARNRWFNRMQDLLDSDDLNIDFYTFMETPRNSIFKLYTLFEFEDSKKCPFTFSPISQDIRFSEFIEKSPERTQFRLDFSYALCTTPKIFACSWSNYSMWTLSAIKKNPEFIGHYRSLVYLFESLPCRFKHLCEWKELGKHIEHLQTIFMPLDSKDKRNRAFSMFVAEYKLYKKAQEIHETPAKATADKKIAGEQKEFAELRVKSSYKRIQQILEEAAPLLSDSFEPDSLIWRLWYHIEKSNKNRTEMEKVAASYDEDVQILILGLHTWRQFLPVFEAAHGEFKRLTPSHFFLSGRCNRRLFHAGFEIGGGDVLGRQTWTQNSYTSK